MSLLIALLMLVCTGCGLNVSNSENESVSTGLFASATPSTSAFSMSYYDGNEGVCGFLYDTTEEGNIVLSLNEVEAVLVTDWTPNLITYPAYGFMIGSEDGNGYQAFWSNGYLVMRDGKVYLFDYDFGKVWEEHSWREQHQFSAFVGYALRLLSGPGRKRMDSL